ncbi:MAG: hypothetical protein ABIH18_09095 [Candidatus Omnitrophota bacterium]
MKDNLKKKEKPKGSRVLLAAVISLLHPVIIGLLVYFTFDKIILFIQEYFFKNQGEMFFRENTIVMLGEFLLIVGIVYSLCLWVVSLEMKYWPWFVKTVSVEGKMKLDENKVIKVAGKLKKFLFILMPLGIFIVYLGINGYIALGNDYIAASRPSLFPNRKEYSYADIKIGRERQQNGSTYSWVFCYKFPDGKTNMGGIEHDVKLMKMIQSKQRELGFKVSEQEDWTPTKKPNVFLQFILLSLFGSTYFFITRFFSKLEKK